MQIEKLAPNLMMLSVLVLLPNAAPASGGVAPTATSSTQVVKALKAVPGFTELPVKKSGSGVEISYRIEGVPEVGIQVTVYLTISSRAEAQVTVRGGEGLVLSRANTTLTSAAGQITQHRVEVTPQTNGRLYLYLESTANGRGSASAIAVQVGKMDVQRKPSGNLQSMPNGERVISVPAR